MIGRNGILLIIVLLFLGAAPAAGQPLLPRPVPPRLVNDFAGILPPAQREALERKLVAFDDTTSNQIAVVIVSDLQGYDRSEFAYRVAHEWGVGQGDFNNGVLVLVRPKSASASGIVFIATGYGLEGAIPDIACAEIIDREMIPRFREEDYYGGIDAGTDVLMALAAGEYSHDRYRDAMPSSVIPAIIIFIVILFIVIAIASGNSNNRHISGSGTSSLPPWLLMEMMGGGRSHGGSWGGFSGGGRSGGGGFGGFGGGGFGGGGAGGSW